MDNGVGNLLFVDLKTGQQRAMTSDSDVTTLALAPDGKTLATGDYEGNVVLREIDTMQELARFQLLDPAPPYWLVPVGAFLLWAFLWFKTRKELSPEDRERITKARKYEN